MDFPEHPFWDFALSVYRREGVGQACLHLQERHGIDVNVLLYCLWFGHSGRGVLTAEDVAAIRAAVQSWHRTVVKGLRLVRRSLKEGYGHAPDDLRTALRAEVQKTEIDAEHLEQLLIAAAVEREPAAEDRDMEARARDAAAAFDAYLDALDIVFEPQDAVDFAHILAQAFRDLSPDTALDCAEILM